MVLDWTPLWTTLWRSPRRVVVRPPGVVRHTTKVSEPKRVTDQKSVRRKRIVPEHAYYGRPSRVSPQEMLAHRQRVCLKCFSSGASRDRPRMSVGDLTTYCGGLQHSTLGIWQVQNTASVDLCTGKRRRASPIPIYPPNAMLPRPEGRTFILANLACHPESTPPRWRRYDLESSHPDTMGLYSDRFHGLLTLFAEFFSTFPHGTCLLSVLWIYLALDRVYDLLSAACSNNATLGERPCPNDCTPTRVWHPPWRDSRRVNRTANSWLT